MNTADRLMQQGIERGIEQGIERGIEQGIERASLENAQRMLEKGYPLKEVMEITGLTEKNLQEHGLIENR